MGSPPLLFRLVALLACTTALAAAAASAADAAPADDARATAAAFIDAIAREDANAICSLFSPNALQKLGGMERCMASESDSENEADFGAYETLSRAYTAARLSATKRNGKFVTKKFGARKLARDMEALDEDLTVKLGKNANAAKGELDSTAVLDTRSTARRIVLYAESDDGSIYRLSATNRGRPTMDEVAVGIPESQRPPAEEEPDVSFAGRIDSVTVDSRGVAFVHATWIVTADGETAEFPLLLLLVPVNGRYLIDDIYYSSFRGDS